MAFLPDGKRVVTASADKSARLWTRSLLWQGRHDGAVRQALVSPRGDRVLSAGADGLVRIWNLADGKPVQSIRAHKDGVAGLALTADSGRIVTAGADSAARVWDWAKMPANQAAGKEIGKALVTMPLPAKALAVTVSPNGQRIAVAVAGEKVALFEAGTGAQWLTIEEMPARVLSFLADNRTLLAAGGQAVRLEDVNVQGAWKVHDGGAAAVAYHNNGAQVLTGGADKTVKLWTLATGKLERTFGPLPEEVSAAGFSRDFTQAAATAGKTLKVFNVADAKELHAIEMPAAARALAFSADRTRVATAGGDGKAYVWDLATRRLAQSYAHAGGATAGVAFHPFTPGQFISAGADKQVGIHMLSLARLVVAGAALEGLAVSPNLQHVLTAGSDGKVGFYNLGTGNRDRVFEGAAKGVTCVAVSRNA